MSRAKNLGAPGRTPEARVRWLLDFVRLEPAQLFDARQAALDVLFAIQGYRNDPTRFRGSVRAGAPAPLQKKTGWLVGETYQLLRDVVETLANGRPYNLAVPELIWTLRPPARRPAGARHSAPITRESAQAEVAPPAMPAMVVLAFVDDLNAIGADRLRTCPLVTDGQACGAVFLATPAPQRYCTPRHAQAAAWQAYLARGGDVERKLRRKG